LNRHRGIAKLQIIYRTKMNNFKRRGLIFLTFFGSCLAISLLTASLNTNYWVRAECKRTTENKERSNGTVNLGLFFYEANLNFGLGDRHFPEKMLGSEGILYRERQFLVYELYIATIACVVAGIFFGIISAMLAIVNAGSNPVEAICHVPGLYLWNGIALFSSTAAFVTWIVQYYLKMKDNLLIYQFREEGKWSSQGGASFGFSFALVVLAAGIYLLDIGIVYIATKDPYRNKNAKLLSALPGKQAGDTMLY